jgi:hypothetical protein
VTPRERSERKAALQTRIEQQRAQLSQAAEGWLTATHNLDRGWQLLVRYRHLAMVGGALLLGWGLLRRDKLAHLYHGDRLARLYRHTPLLFSLGSWLLSRRQGSR